MKVPKVLVVHPQRAPSSVLFMLFGAGLVIASLREGLKYQVKSWADVVVLVGMAAFPALFFVLGLHGWLLRVELSVSADGLLTMKWTRWPLSPRLKSLPHADVTDVVITTSDSTEHIVVLTKDEAIPLTRSSTSDNLTAKVAEMKAFLHIA